MLVRALMLYLILYLAYRAYKWYRGLQQRIADRKASAENDRQYRVHIDKNKIEDAEYHEIKDGD